MLAKVYSFGLIGIEAYPIEIEVDVSNGLPAVTIVGLADTAIRESKERVKSAIKNSGFEWPGGRITINLAPSDIKKEGPSFDLAIALGILSATGQLNSQNLNRYCVLGELSLDGSLRPTQGILPISIVVAKSKVTNILLPAANAKEASIVSNVSAFPIHTLRHAVEFLNNSAGAEPFKLCLDDVFRQQSSYEIDFSEIKGQRRAKRAFEVAVAGNHNILMIGPPGSGKSMLAQRIPTIMPDLSIEEALEITKIHSVMGTLPVKDGILATRPFRNPHHTVSDVALTGGGSVPKPGEISLAHGGVLFLDELPEFNRNCLEALRQPLEEEQIRISRTNKSVTFPARFMLVCAMNPCPCGYYTDTKKPCRCNPAKIQNYIGKISGPLLDRIDIQLDIPSLRYKEISEPSTSESSKEIKWRIEKAHRIQKQRFSAEGIFYNAQMNSRLIRKYCLLNKEAKSLLDMAMDELNFSARAYDKILKVSRTIADLADADPILPDHISEAVQYRNLDKIF